MIREAEANAEEDKKQRDLIEARNSAEGQLHSLKTDLKEVEHRLTEDQKVKINSAIDALEQAIMGNDKDQIVEKTSELIVAGQIVAEAKVTPTATDNTTSKKDDTVVDAEFTEVKKDDSK